MIVLPFSLPVGYFVSPQNIFGPNLQEVTTLFDLNLWFDKFILCGCGGIKDGQDWALYINGKAYLAIWRDKPPRPPWTQAVWDVYEVSPPCGNCPSVPRGLGWFWCWNDVVQVIRSEALASWQDQYEGPGGQIELIGTNEFGPSTIKMKGPLLWLAENKETTLGKVTKWIDDSGHGNIVFQEETFAPGVITIGSQDFVSFSGSEWLRLRLPPIQQWHVFAVGFFNSSLLNDWGTIFAASGLVSPFSGVDCLITQNGNVTNEGTQGTFIFPNFVSGGLTSSSGTVTLWEWKQTSSESFVGKNAFSQKILSNISNDSWNPMSQNGSFSLPVEASIGRSNRGMTIGQAFSWFEGGIAEILIYDFPLKSGQRTQVLNYLRAKYNLGPPLQLPNPV